MNTIRRGLPIVPRRVEPVVKAEFPTDLRKGPQQDELEIIEGELMDPEEGVEEPIDAEWAEVPREVVLSEGLQGPLTALEGDLQIREILQVLGDRFRNVSHAAAAYEDEDGSADSTLLKIV